MNSKVRDFIDKKTKKKSVLPAIHIYGDTEFLIDSTQKSGFIFVWLDAYAALFWKSIRIAAICFKM